MSYVARSCHAGLRNVPCSLQARLCSKSQQDAKDATALGERVNTSMWTGTPGSVKNCTPIAHTRAAAGKMMALGRRSSSCASDAERC